MRHNLFLDSVQATKQGPQIILDWWSLLEDRLPSQLSPFSIIRLLLSEVTHELITTTQQLKGWGVSWSGGRNSCCPLVFSYEYTWYHLLPRIVWHLEVLNFHVIHNYSWTVSGTLPCHPNVKFWHVAKPSGSKSENVVIIWIGSG